MRDGRITIHGDKGEPTSSIKVHLSFEVPEIMMQMLVDELKKGFERWEDRIVAMGELG